MNISKYFTWKEATFLPRWNRTASEEELPVDIRNNLIVLFTKMDVVREHFNLPINVHVAYRPKAYNALIGGAKNSSHMYGLAVDFSVQGLNCDAVRQSILDAGLLESLNMRMECNPGSNWVHIDIREVPHGGSRYFNP